MKHRLARLSGKYSCFSKLVLLLSKIDLLSRGFTSLTAEIFKAIRTILLPSPRQAYSHLQKAGDILMGPPSCDKLHVCMSSASLINQEKWEVLEESAYEQEGWKQEELQSSPGHAHVDASVQCALESLGAGLQLLAVSGAQTPKPSSATSTRPR